MFSLWVVRSRFLAHDGRGRAQAPRTAPRCVHAPSYIRTNLVSAPAIGYDPLTTLVRSLCPSPGSSNSNRSFPDGLGLVRLSSSFARPLHHGPPPAHNHVSRTGHRRGLAARVRGLEETLESKGCSRERPLLRTASVVVSGTKYAPSGRKDVERCGRRGHRAKAAGFIYLFFWRCPVRRCIHLSIHSFVHRPAVVACHRDALVSITTL